MDETDEDIQIREIEAAFRQAARDVVRVARQTGTPVIVWEDGRIREIPCETAELDVWIDQADGSAGRA